MQALIEKNKELLASSELTPEALGTAKTGLETLIALLKEDKPAVFVDPATGVEVQFSNLEPTVVKGLKVAKVEANQTEKEELKGREATIFDIEGVDASGQNVDTQHPSLVKIPVDKDKEVEQVLYLPEGHAPQSLAFERVGDVVIFTAPHFTHYAIVYKTPSPVLPDQPIQPEEPSKPDQPIQPSQPLEPSENPKKPVQPSPTEQKTLSVGHAGLVDQKIDQLVSQHQEQTQEEGESQEAKEESHPTSSDKLPTTASLEATFAAEAVLLAALGGFLLAGKKKEE